MVFETVVVTVTEMIALTLSNGHSNACIYGDRVKVFTSLSQGIC